MINNHIFKEKLKTKLILLYIYKIIKKTAKAVFFINAETNRNLNSHNNLSQNFAH